MSVFIIFFPASNRSVQFYAVALCLPLYFRFDLLLKVENENAVAMFPIFKDYFNPN